MGVLNAEDIELEEYAVTGETCGGVAKNIRRARRADARLKGYDAASMIDTRFTPQADGSVCFRASIRVLLPRLDSGSAAVRACFERYRLALEEHESLHVESFRKAIADSRALLTLDLPAMRAAAAVIDARIRAEEAEVERQTDHGGRACRFPPADCPHA